MKTVSDKAVRYSHLSVQNIAQLDVPGRLLDVRYYVKICPKLIYFFKNADFHSIFARSSSAVTPSEKKIS